MKDEGVRVGGVFLARIVEFLRDENGQPVLDEFGDIIITRIVQDGIVINNGATVQGLNHALETQFRGGTPVTTWYATVINNAAYSGVSSADTAASHPGWPEWTGYNEAVRPTWTPGAASGGVIVNSSAMTFTNSSGSTVTIRGLAIFPSSTKGATTAPLWATAVESGGRDLADGQAFQAVYQVTMFPSS